MKRTPLASLGVVIPVALVLLGSGVVLMRLLERIAWGPSLFFNSTRVATSIAMARGYNIMAGQEDGPVLDFMYGPVSAFAYIPTSLSPTPSGAIWAGVVMSFLFVVGPFAWLVFACAKSSARAIAYLAVVCFSVLCFYDPALSMVASNIHADAPSIGLAACACACLFSEAGRPSTRRMIASALFAVLAVWAKQTAVPIVLALPAYIWLRDGRDVAFRFTLWMGAVGVAVSLLFVLRYGIEGIVFTMFQIPGGHSWPSGDLWESVDGRGAAAITSLARLVKVSLFSGGLVIVVAAVSFRRASSPIRSWLQDQPWLGLGFVGLVMIPASVVGAAKLGGNTNSYGLTTYFLMGAGVLGLAQLAWARPSPSHRAARLALAGIILFASVDALGSEGQASIERTFGELRAWRSNPVEQATAFARKHPHEVLFVSNPLIGLYSDGLLYNSAVGFGDRILSGYLVSPALRRQYIPSKLRYVGVLRQGVLGPNPRPAVDYPDFTKEYRIRGLRHYRIWTKRLGEE